MSPTEQAAFRAGIEAARQMALTAAITLEVRDDGGETRQRAAAAALQGLADGLSSVFLAPIGDSALVRTLALIAEDPADNGTAACPTCGGPFDWIRAGPARHLHGECRTSGCLRVMQ